jgi:Protein of unknown function, DUF547
MKSLDKNNALYIFLFLFININIALANSFLAIPFTNLQNNTSDIHTEWNSLLNKYVKDGKVNYKNFKAEKSNVDAYIAKLSKNSPNEKATKNEKLAYWCNLYNSITIQTILANYPLKSIKDLDNGKPWDTKRITINTLKYSLNDIENNILRKMNDPRIHFAINCAAKSCPPISNTAFTAQNIENQLTKLTIDFINKSSNKSNNVITISKIFDWYGTDFGNKLEFINKYSKVKYQLNTETKYADYDWSLNQ